jgi:hypothetical protein
MKKGIASLAGFASFIFVIGCVAPRERHVVVRHPAPVVRERVRAPIVIRQAPPPPVREVVPPAPGRRYVWVPGYWVWSDRWVWQGGRWEAPPRERAVWREGRWVERRGEWYWEPGGWR